MTRKIVLYIATSLDGYIAGANDDISWLFTDQDYGYREFVAGIDTVIMGRSTYEFALSFGDYPYPGKTGYVFSRTMAGKQAPHVTFVAEEIRPFVKRLKAAPGKDIWLIGGAELARDFLLHNRIDEYVISIHPVLLGGGTQLFPPGFARQHLRLQDCKTFDSGLVQLTYLRTAQDV